MRVSNNFVDYPAFKKVNAIVNQSIDYKQVSKRQSVINTPH